MNWEAGIDIYTLLTLCVKLVSNENLLYSSGNLTQCSFFMFSSVGNAVTVGKKKHTILPKSKTTMTHALLNLDVMGEGRKCRGKGKFTDSWKRSFNSKLPCSQ